MGRSRKPVAEHIQSGNYRPGRHGPIPADPGDATAPPPTKPADLTGDAAAAWETITRLLAGAIRDRDGPLLAEACAWWAELRRVRASLAAMEPGAKGYTGLLVAAGICTDKLDKLLSRFGMTPADRAKLRTVEPIRPAAKVASRPATKIDRRGPPKPKAGR